MGMVIDAKLLEVDKYFIYITGLGGSCINGKKYVKALGKLFNVQR